MKEPKLKTVYVCSNCGETSPRWMGRCPSCGSWNTMNEDVVAETPKAGLSGGKSAAPARQEGVTSLTAKRLADISTTEEKSRILTGISELDRVLGGGIVLGGVVLLSGEPGVGKSTMLLQLCGAISNQHTVLYITGEESVRQVKLRAAKNRYGSTNELGMFDMTGQGLEEIENPSQMLLEGRPLGVSGNCVACTMEGSRPILSEIQALATKTNFPAPRRACSGYDYNRMNLLIAVLEKRAGYFFGNLDVYINIVGGIALRDTACDLAVCLSMVSSLLDCPVSDKLIAIGEVGLGGEVRSVPNLEQRLREAERIGFERAVIPKHSLPHLNAADYPGMKLVGVAYISDAIHALKSDRL